MVCHFFARKFDADTIQVLLDHVGLLLSDGSYLYNESLYVSTSRFGSLSTVAKGITHKISHSFSTTMAPSIIGDEIGENNVSSCLHIITCDTRAGSGGSRAWFESLRRVAGVHRKMNVCAGKRWIGFRTKLESVLKYAQDLIIEDNSSVTPPSNRCAGQDIILFADGIDVFFNTNSAEDIIKGWNIARGVKSLLFGAEMSCWVKEICSQEDMDKIYNSSFATSRAAFINTGVYMGLPAVIIEVFQYVLRVYRPLVLKYDDQAGIAMYFSEHPQNISIDRHWMVFGTLQLMKPIVDVDKSLPKYEYPGNKFSCLGNGTNYESVNVAKRCYQIKYRLKDIFSLHEDTCTIELKPLKSPWIEGTFSLVKQLYKFPTIFHGNGRYTKGTLYDLQGWGSLCLKKRVVV